MVVYATFLISKCNLVAKKHELPLPTGCVFEGVQVLMRTPTLRMYLYLNFSLMAGYVAILLWIAMGSQRFG